MTIRVPNLLNLLDSPPAPVRSREASIRLLADFLWTGLGRTVLLSGAGLSVDSGIRSYRGKGGSYNDTNKLHRPIFYHEFIASAITRRRYWARSYLGYPTVRIADPNPSHYAIAALQRLGTIQHHITQNVDGLSHKAIDSTFQAYLTSPSLPIASTSTATASSPSSLTAKVDPTILELHGTLRHVHCLECEQLVGRDAFQDRLSLLNPEWSDYADQVSVGTQQQRLNPDGDIELGTGTSYEDFTVPACDACGGPMKPKVTFFGESLSPAVRDLSTSWVSSSSQLLVLGSSLATFSAFRLVRQKRAEGGEVMLLNVGTSRGDAVATERIGWEGGAGDLLPSAARLVLERVKKDQQKGGMDEQELNEIEMLLGMGKVKKVSEEAFSTS